MATKAKIKPLVGILMGSTSDWETMQHACDTLDLLGVAHEVRVVSAHRTPDLLHEYAESAADRGLQVVIAGAGGAAHLPGIFRHFLRHTVGRCRSCSYLPAPTPLSVGGASSASCRNSE